VVGSTVRPYKIAEKLGDGGTGVGYKTEDLRRGRAEPSPD